MRVLILLAHLWAICGWFMNAWALLKMAWVLPFAAWNWEMLARALAMTDLWMAGLLGWFA